MLYRIPADEHSGQYDCWVDIGPASARVSQCSERGRWGRSFAADGLLRGNGDHERSGEGPHDYWFLLVLVYYGGPWGGHMDNGGCDSDTYATATPMTQRRQQEEQQEEERRRRP
eukprot:11118693-Alexandrium_andersonii.AAC.1